MSWCDLTYQLRYVIKQQYSQYNGMTKFIMSTIFQSFRNLLFDLILHVSEDSSSVLMAEQAEIGNV